MSYTFEEKLIIMRELESGLPLSLVCRRHGISDSYVEEIRYRYRLYGESGLCGNRKKRYPASLKQAVVSEIKEKGLSLLSVSLRRRIDRKTIQRWLRLYDSGSTEALCRKRRTGRPSKEDMGRPRKKTYEEMTELERLRYDNMVLRAENALLKKLKALAEEEEARRRSVWQKPSTD